jgi:hypothetical protein
MISGNMNAAEIASDLAVKPSWRKSLTPGDSKPWYLKKSRKPDSPLVFAFGVAGWEAWIAAVDMTEPRVAWQCPNAGVMSLSDDGDRGLRNCRRIGPA